MTQTAEAADQELLELEPFATVTFARQRGHRAGWLASYWPRGESCVTIDDLWMADPVQLRTLRGWVSELAWLVERRLTYYDYLTSEAWAELRERALEAADGCIICCSTDRLDVHHRTYERFGEEEARDLTVLCRTCHDIFHAAKRLNAKVRS